MLSGDTLFVGDIARPDLAVDKDEGAREIFRSLHERLLALARRVEVWPGHLGGSLCGGPGDGHEGLLDDRLRARATTTLLHEEDEDALRRARDSPPSAPQPPNFQAIVEINRGAAGCTARVDAAPAHSAPGRASARDGRAASSTCARDLQFDDAHIPGSVCDHGAAGRLRHQARLGGRPRRRRSCSSAATTTTRRAAAPARRGGRHRARRRLPGRRDDELARRSSRDVGAHRAHRRAGPARAPRARPGVQVLDVRERGRVARRPHPRTRCTSPTTTSARLPDGLDPARAGRGHLRVGPAQRRRRLAAPAPRAPRT